MFCVCSYYLRLSSLLALPLECRMSDAATVARTAGETDAAEITARILLETEAVLFRPDDPFTFTSGRLSPVYIDCRRLISFPRARRKLMDMGAKLIENRIGIE